MLFALLSLMTVIQTQPLAQVPVPQIATPIVATQPPAPPESPSPTIEEPVPVEAALPEPEPEPEAEPELPTRQVCRYVEVTGQRFPVRSCRTVTIYPDESH